MQGIAFFDFDGTLVRGDSLLPFLGEVAGRRPVRWALARAIKAAVRQPRGPAAPDLRTAVKASLLHQVLAGVSMDEARAAARRMAGWPRWNRRVLDTLRHHKEAGRRVVIATGALDVYMTELVDGLEVDAVLATGLEAVDGVLTGRMAGGNCVRANKAHRVAAYLHEHGPFGESWGYGNRPSDLPMLALLKHRTII